MSIPESSCYKRYALGMMTAVYTLNLVDRGLINLLLQYLIGMGIGPQIVGILSDLLNPTFGDHALRFAMMIMSLVAVWSGWHFWQVAKSIKGDLLVAQHQEAQISQRSHADIHTVGRTA